MALNQEDVDDIDKAEWSSNMALKALVVSKMIINMEDSDSDSSDELEDMAQHIITCMNIYEYRSSYIDKVPCHTSILSGAEYVQELLKGHPDRIYDSFRMDKHVFLRLCYTLKTQNLLSDDRHVGIHEAVAIFLYIVSHSERMRMAAERFQRSKDTIHRQFKRVLTALCKLAPQIIRHQSQGETPLEIMNNPKFYPYFEKCIGAIDGTHVAAWAPAQKQTSYRGRKVNVSQNVMCACSFDMMFTFVYTGWEGTANDSRVFLDAVSRPENKFPSPIEGYYYVVDAGYTNMPGFLAPYRGERYHLRDYRGPRHAPRGPKELFNYRHSSLRNVIERCFGVLKARFPILKYMPNYPPRRQRLIPIACCVLHNFIRKEARRDRLFETFNNEDMIFEEENNAPTNLDMSHENIAQMTATRNEIAQRLWNDFTPYI